MKDYLALALIIFAVPVCAAVMVFWRRARDLGFFALVFGAMVTYDLDVNFVSRE